MQNDLWQKPPEDPQVTAREAHIWRIALADRLDHIGFLCGLLSQDEKERAERFHFQKDRERFIAARAGLRIILSKYVNRDPASLVFGYNRYGKPFLQSPAAPVYFNLSHANQLALYALSGSPEIGVDVEYISPHKDAREIIARFFSENEKTEFQQLPEFLRLRAFFSGWTRKEAFVKARGEGLSFPLEKFSVSLHPDQPAGPVLVDPDKKDGREWVIRDIPVDAAYRAAVAVADPELHFSYWEVSGLKI